MVQLSQKFIDLDRKFNDNLYFLESAELEKLFKR